MKCFSNHYFLFVSVFTIIHVTFKYKLSSLHKWLSEVLVEKSKFLQHYWNMWQSFTVNVNSIICQRSKDITQRDHMTSTAITPPIDTSSTWRCVKAPCLYHNMRAGKISPVLSAKEDVYIFNILCSLCCWVFQQIFAEQASVLQKCPWH